MERIASPMAGLRDRIVFAPENSGPGRAAGEAPRILVVEDEYLVGVQIESSLLDAGFAVVGPIGGADEAVQAVEAEQPSLVVMDIRLAGQRDGVDAALEIYRKTGIRCIFATAHVDPALRRRAEPAAPLGWVSKPYRMETLIAMIRDVLKPGSN